MEGTRSEVRASTTSKPRNFGWSKDLHMLVHAAGVAQKIYDDQYAALKDECLRFDMYLTSGVASKIDIDEHHGSGQSTCFSPSTRVFPENDSRITCNPV